MDAFAFPQVVDPKYRTFRAVVLGNANTKHGEVVVLGLATGHQATAPAGHSPWRPHQVVDVLVALPTGDALAIRPAAGTSHF